jgi:glycerol-3-phosphate dehydrogenase
VELGGALKNVIAIACGIAVAAAWAKAPAPRSLARLAEMTRLGGRWRPP